MFDVDLHTTVRPFNGTTLPRHLLGKWGMLELYNVALISFSLHDSELCFWLYVFNKAQQVLKSMCQTSKSRSWSTVVCTIRVQCSGLSRFLFWRSPAHHSLMCQPGKCLSWLCWGLSEIFLPPKEIWLNLDLTVLVQLKENFWEVFVMGEGRLWNWDFVTNTWKSIGCSLCAFPMRVTLQTKRSGSPGCWAWLCTYVIALLCEMAGHVKIALLTQMHLMPAEKYHWMIKLEHLVLLSHNQQQTESKTQKNGVFSAFFSSFSPAFFSFFFSIFFSIFFFLIPFHGLLFFRSCRNHSFLIPLPGWCQSYVSVTWDLCENIFLNLYSPLSAHLRHLL